MIFRPDIKPPMWGLPEVVQWAVRDNAEKMGIDPFAIKVFIASWEGGGNKLHNYGTYIDSTLNGDYTWENGGLTYNSASAGYKNDIVKRHTNISFLFRGKHVTESWTYPPLIGLGGDRELALGTNNNQFRVRQYLAGTSVGGNIATPDVSDDKISDVVFSYNYSAGVSAKLYLDGEIVAQQAYDLSGGDWHRLPNLSVLNGSTIGWLDTLGLFTCALSDNQVVQLHHEPYALLMPVARPFIFDMAGGGGLAAPTLISPAQFSTQAQPVTLEWQAVSGATKYHVQVAEDNLFTTPVVDEIVTGGTTLGVNGLSDGTDHFWRVQAGDETAGTDGYTITSAELDNYTIGDALGGGHYAGKIVSDYDAKTYALILSDGQGDSLQRGEPRLVFMLPDSALIAPAQGTPPMTLADGKANCDALVAFDTLARFPALEWLYQTLNAGEGLNQFTDWYLPSRDELELLYRHFKPGTGNNTTILMDAPSTYFGAVGQGVGVNNNSLPTGSAYTTTDPQQTPKTTFQVGGVDAFTTADYAYCSSSESADYRVWTQKFADGEQNYYTSKGYDYYVRAVRRIEVL